MATSAPPIKTDLFRFITFRSPDEAGFGLQSTRFVKHPDIEGSLANSCPIPGREESFEDYINQFPMYGQVSDITKDIDPKFFDYVNDVFKRKTPLQDIRGEAAGALEFEQEQLLFETLIGEVLSNRSKSVRQAISKVLIVNHAIRRAGDIRALGLSKLTELKIEIPVQAIECYKRWKYRDCGGNLDGVQSLGIADFRRVEQEVCCYVPGEVSHIENIMAKEYKERTTRNFVRTEDTTETSRETEIENLTDVTTTTRNELSTEVAQVLDQQNTSNYGGSMGVSAEFTKVKIDINAYADFSNSNASSYSNAEAKVYAEEVTKRALERIVQKTSEKRTSKIIKEFEENNKHGFDNRTGESHVTGVYRWVDIIYKNRLVNYGKRLMVEFMVPEPAEFYKKIREYRQSVVEDVKGNEEDIEAEAPKSLAELGINSPSDITRDNYNVIAQNYGIILNAPKDEFKTLNQSILPPCPPNSDNNAKSYQQSISIEPDYETYSVSGKVDINYKWANPFPGPSPIFKMDIGYFNVTVGSFPKGNSVNKTIPFGTVFTTKYTGSISVNFDYKKMNSITASIELKLKLTAAKFQEWQNYCYQTLMDAYNRALSNFNNSLETEETIEDDVFLETKNTNPAMNRITEQRELKRICIEMLMKPFCRVQGRDNNIDENACDLYQIPQVNQDGSFTSYASTVKFFEQAIDWQLMSYLFYPYYWADKCDWAGLMQSEDDDLVFQAFLQSGMARVVVPIRPQFNEAFAFYIETGEIWLANDLVAGTDLSLSIAEEMQTVEGVVEEEWETRVPTTLAIIQGKSAYLEQEGLPCCAEVGESTIIPSLETLSLLPPATT